MGCTTDTPFVRDSQPGRQPCFLEDVSATAIGPDRPRAIASERKSREEISVRGVVMFASGDVRAEDVEEPKILAPTDAVGPMA